MTTPSKLRPNILKDPDRPAPVTVYPSSRKEHAARTCSRCFARNIIGETFCKVCGDELQSTAVDIDLGMTRRVEVASVTATLIVHGEGEVSSDVSLALDKDIVLVGRSSPADNVRPDVDLSPFDAHNYVSRRHAFILRRQGTIVLEDLESVNGTFVNVTQQLSPHVLTPLRDGDDVTFGQTRCTIRIDNAPMR